MATATLTSKWQITIPAAVREALHVGVGDRIEFVQTADGRFEVVAATREISELKGMVKTNKVVSLEDMELAIKKGVSGDRS
jgi:antitoxin PrlF